MIKRGDIIAWGVNKNTTSWISKAIGFISRYTVGNWVPSNQISYSHVSIVSEVEDWHYESTWPKTRHTQFDTREYEKYEIIVIRYEGITDEQRDKVIEYCKDNMNLLYDWISLLTLGLINSKKVPVCSDFASAAYRYAGIELEKSNEKLYSPNELVFNPKFKTTSNIRGSE